MGDDGEKGQEPTITLRPEQEQLLRESSIRSGLAQSTESETFDQALDTLRNRMPKPPEEKKCVATVARRLFCFGKRHGLSLGGSTIKDPLREGRQLNRFVLDASIVLTWCFPDEESKKAQEVVQASLIG